MPPQGGCHATLQLSLSDAIEDDVTFSTTDLAARIGDRVIEALVVPLVCGSKQRKILSHRRSSDNQRSCSMFPATRLPTTPACAAGLLCMSFPCVSFRFRACRACSACRVCAFIHGRTLLSSNRFAQREWIHGRLRMHSDSGLNCLWTGRDGRSDSILNRCRIVCRFGARIPACGACPTDSGHAAKTFYGWMVVPSAVVGRIFMLRNSMAPP